MNLIKLYSYGGVEGISCSKGIKQKIYLKYGDIISLPTFSFGGLFTTMMIVAYEGHYVSTFDVPGA